LTRGVGNKVRRRAAWAPGLRPRPTMVVSELSTALQPGSHPRLASHVRLGFDRVRKQYMLQVPEAVTVLNLTGAAVLHLCDGQRTVAEIVAKLHDQYDRVDDGEVADFLARLVTKRWVELDDD
jgi:pyrroloquinoline quinone biosynthesis protein D